MQNNRSDKSSRLEMFLALAGLAICLFVTAFIWGGIASQQPMWPLPGAYFTEVMVLSAVNGILWVTHNRWRRWVNLAAAGIFSVLVVIGLFSIGLFYIPNALIYLLLAILSGIRAKQKPWLPMAIALIAAAVQLLLMLLAIGSVPPI